MLEKLLNFKIQMSSVRGEKFEMILSLTDICCMQFKIMLLESGGVVSGPPFIFDPLALKELKGIKIL